MTTKHDVDFAKYRKAPRRLPETLFRELAAGGGLAPLLEHVLASSKLCLEIRDGRFNVYYRGGNLLLVDARSKAWDMKFDTRYCAASAVPALPGVYSGRADTHQWIRAFGQLQQSMDRWWDGNAKQERDDCQCMALANAARDRLPAGDYVIVDMEYQWAQRRFDLVALRRAPSMTDADGWDRPDLVMVEVKSDMGACVGNAGLKVHENDYRQMLAAPAVQHERMRQEFEGVCAQKRALGLLEGSVARGGISEVPLGLLFVFVGMRDKRAEIARVLQAGPSAGGAGQPEIGFLELDRAQLVMQRNAVMDRAAFLRLGGRP